MQYQPVDIIGGFYTDDALPWSAQDTVNWLPVMAEVDGTRTLKKLRMPPGLKPRLSVGEGPIRGSISIRDQLFVVSGNELYRVPNTGDPVLIGTIPGVGLVSMSYNQRGLGNELLVVNGDAGYVHNTATGTFGKITDEGYPGAVVGEYLDSFLLQVEPFGRFWFHSQLADALNYDTTDRYESEASPDKIVTLVVNQFEVVVFNETTTEFFANVGSAINTFQSKRIVIDKGCASRFSAANIDNSTMWLGHDGVIYRLEGYSAVPVSTRAIERAIANEDWSQAFAMVWEDEGHKVYYLTFPSGRTWGYDVVSRLWHRRATYTGNKELDGRWRINTLTFWQGQWIGGDAYSGKLYDLAWDYPYEDSMPLVRERVSGVTHSNQNRVFAPYAELVIEMGVGLDKQGEEWPVILRPTISGDLPDGDVGVAIQPYTYTTSGGVLPIGNFSIVSGALPPGLSMDAAGTVTGTPTQGGTFTWTVQVNDADGVIATHEDSAAFWVTQWLLTQTDTSTLKPYQDAVWIGEDVTDWTGSKLVRRDPFAYIDRGAYGGGYLQVADNVAIGASSDGSIERAVGFGATNSVATTLDTTTITGTPCRIRRYGGLVIITTSNEAFYYTSEDAGLTWTKRAAPSSRIYDIAKVGDRWVTEGSGADGFFYSDEAVPATWAATSSTDFTSNALGAIASNGAVAVKIGSLGRVFRTVDGLSWSETGVSVTQAMMAAVAIGDVFVFCVNNGTDACRSTDAGLTFTNYALPFNTKRIDVIDGLMVFCTVGGGLYYSTDGGATLSPSAMPVPFDSSETFFAAKFRYLP